MAILVQVSHITQYVDDVIVAGAWLLPNGVICVGKIFVQGVITIVYKGRYNWMLINTSCITNIQIRSVNLSLAVQ